MLCGWTVDLLMGARSPEAGGARHGTGLSAWHGDTGIALRTLRMPTPGAAPAVLPASPSYVAEAAAVASVSWRQAGPPIYALLRVYRL